MAFVRVFPIGSPVYGDFSAPAQVAILVGQIVVPSLGGPLLGVALGRWISFPGAAFVAFLLIFGWVELVTVPSLTHPDSAPIAALRESSIGLSRRDRLERLFTTQCLRSLFQ